jgi:hypothetical protein
VIAELVASVLGTDDQDPAGEAGLTELQEGEGCRVLLVAPGPAQSGGLCADLKTRLVWATWTIRDGRTDS